MDKLDPQAIVADLKRCIALMPRIVLMIEMGAYHAERGEVEAADGELRGAETLLRRRLGQVEEARAALCTDNGAIIDIRSQPAS